MTRGESNPQVMAVADMKRKEIHSSEIAAVLKELIRQASFELSIDVEERFDAMIQSEESRTGISTLEVLRENSMLARTEKLPLCQDCGAAIIFIELGQDVSITGGLLEEVINDAVADAYREFNLRSSIVSDPLKRINTGTNTPSFIHTDIVPGSTMSLTVYLKGGGSENMTSLKMFRPTDPVEDIIEYIASMIAEAGPNPCPPLFLGVGIGGTADVALVNAKKAVLRGINVAHADPFYSELEIRIREKCNETGVGPLGFGGSNTVAGVYIKEAPTHIATLPVALNLGCHSMRYRKAVL